MSPSPRCFGLSCKSATSPDHAIESRDPRSHGAPMGLMSQDPAVHSIEEAYFSSARAPRELRRAHEPPRDLIADKLYDSWLLEVQEVIGREMNLSCALAESKSESPSRRIALPPRRIPANRVPTPRAARYRSMHAGQRTRFAGRALPAQQTSFQWRSAAPGYRRTGSPSRKWLIAASTSL